MTRISNNGKKGLYLQVVSYEKPKHTIFWKLKKLFSRIKKEPEAVKIHIDSNKELIDETINNEN